MANTKKAANQPKKSAIVERTAAFKDDVGLRLLSKPEVIAVSGCSFPVLWRMMQEGTFPRAKVVGGRSMWRSDEINAWIAELPVRPLKGDAAELVSS
jgi:predicted DNA-binding transcriptional regulator AlpA